MFTSQRRKSTASIITAIALLNLGACTTTGTKQRVLAEPMTDDLEAQVLKETGTSGAVIGAVGGAVLGALGGLVLAASTDASSEEALAYMAAGAVVGGTALGVEGYKEGKKRGQQVVAQAMTRDQVAKYLEGAKAYNDRLAQSNALLGSEANRARQLQKPGQRKARLAQIDKAARTELKDVDKRLAQRQKAVSSLDFGSKADEAAARQRLAELERERSALVNIVNSLDEA